MRQTTVAKDPSCFTALQIALLGWPGGSEQAARGAGVVWSAKVGCRQKIGLGERERGVKYEVR